jgi:FAD/FMN-containing dehydrogenase
LFCAEEHDVTITSDPIGADLARRLDGAVLAPGDDGFVEASGPWSRAVEHPVRAVVRADSPADVVATLRYARANGLTVAAQAVGHGATSALSGTVLLRTSGLRGVEVRADEQRVRVGAGARWGDVLAALSGTGLVALSGSSPSPSVVGYLLGGGLSWFGRRFGLAANAVVEFEAVTAEGELLRVSASEHPELFWALRGGGGDYAVVTAVTFGTHPVPGLAGGRLAWPADRAAALLDAYRAVTATAPDELSAWFGLLALPDLPGLPPALRGARLATVDVTFLGSASTGREYLSPLSAVGPPLSDTFDLLDIADLGTICDEPTEPTFGMPRAWPLGRLDDDVTAGLLDTVRPDFGDGPGTPLVSVQVRHLGGALAREVPGGGAAPVVSAPYVCTGVATGTPELRGAARERLGALDDALSGVRAGLTPYNFLGDGQRAADAFPADVLKRLRDVKRAWDPHRVIRSNRPVD